MSHSNEGAQPFLTLEEVALRVGGDTLFAGLNWTIRADQQWALIGPNGAGKSTLAKALCHEVDVVRGRIRYFFDEVGSPARPYFKRWHCWESAISWNERLFTFPMAKRKRSCWPAR